MTNIEGLNQLIDYLLAIANFAKDIHYTAHGEAFYSKHELADRVEKNLYDYIDRIKEVCLLANDVIPLPSGEYLVRATSLIPTRDTENDAGNFERLKFLITKALNLMEQMSDLGRGENNLIDEIAHDLQSNLGLINLQVKDVTSEKRKVLLRV